MSFSCLSTYLYDLLVTVQSSLKFLFCRETNGMKNALWLNLRVVWRNNIFIFSLNSKATIWGVGGDIACLVFLYFLEHGAWSRGQYLHTDQRIFLDYLIFFLESFWKLSVHVLSQTFLLSYLVVVMVDINNLGRVQTCYMSSSEKCNFLWCWWNWILLCIMRNLAILVLSNLNFFLLWAILLNKEENKLTCIPSLGTAVHFLVLLTSKPTLVFNN